MNFSNTLTALIAISLLLTVTYAILGYEEERMEKGNIETICIDGVLYYHEFRRLAPVFNAESRVVTCGVE